MDNITVIPAQEFPKSNMVAISELQVAEHSRSVEAYAALELALLKNELSKAYDTCDRVLAQICDVQEQLAKISDRLRLCVENGQKQ